MSCVSNPDVGGLEMNKFVQAALHVDWQQVVLNGGPPCFCLEDGKFCLRAQRWDGHFYKGFHEFVPLAAMIASALETTGDA